MARLAIISSYNENCGNASYTHVLKTAFGEHVDVDVLPLDLFLLQKRSRLFRGAADRHIKELAKKLAAYDYVNIQFEAGLYGASIPDIRRRISWLIKAAPNLILTMHRIDVGHVTRGQAFAAALRTRSLRLWRSYIGGLRFVTLYRDIIGMVEHASRTKNAWIKVHTRRERRVVSDIYGFAKCFDYPLAFLTPEQRRAALTYTDRSAFRRKYDFGADDRIIGLFGYISEYKGIETAIQSLSHLPDNYKLALFGSHHPQAVLADTPLHPYLGSLVGLMDEVDDEIYKGDMKLARLQRLGRPQVVMTQQEPDRDPLGHAQMESRVRFIGSVPDPEFIEALRLCDVVVLPYIEVGQSMSGVVVLAMESGARMICASNPSFAEVKKYFGEAFMSFDMGNFVELAQKIRFCDTDPDLFECEPARTAAFERYNIRNSVLEQLARFGHKVE